MRCELSQDLVCVLQHLYREKCVGINGSAESDGSHLYRMPKQHFIALFQRVGFHRIRVHVRLCETMRGSLCELFRV